MAEYYYLVTSLPFLRYKEPPVLCYKDFIDSCAFWMNKKDLHQVKRARIDIEKINIEEITNPLLSSWMVFEHSLRNELVRSRAQNMGVQAENYLRTHINSDPTVATYVREAVKDPSPYKAETALIELRWDFLTNNEVGHYFDETSIIIYGLKLQLLERLSMFKTEKGQKVFHIIYEGNKDEEERKYRENNSN